jgi:hypothetical protein
VFVDSDGNGDKLVQGILAKHSGLMAKSASFALLKRSLQTLRGRRQYNKKISKDSIVPMLQKSASHFDKFATKARTLTTTTDPQPSPLEQRHFFELLESVTNTSASVLSEIANVIQTADTVTAGLLTTSIVSILGCFERVNVRTTAVLIDNVSTVMRESTNSTAATSQGALVRSKTGYLLMLWTFYQPNETSRAFMCIMKVIDLHNLWTTRIPQLQHM